MLLRNEWQVRTRFRVLVVKVVPIPTLVARPSAESLIADLLFEVQHRSGGLARTLTEIHEALGKANARPLLGFDWLPATSPADDVVRELRAAIGQGFLVVEELRAPTAVPLLDPPEPDPPPAPPPDVKPTTFVAISVKDDGGSPMSIAFRIKLPNGEVREGHTSLDGTARVDGITGGGKAQVTFLDYDDRAIAPA